MYATCIFCHAKLGSNEAIEHFPIGKRLAFDAAKGRLWVVCPRCERWNLSPIEERWEAIEDAERSYRDTPQRAGTDNIGLARVADGTELIRIGSPLRPEFAAWRYGDQFGRRQLKTVLQLGASAMAASAAIGLMLLDRTGMGAMIGVGAQGAIQLVELGMAARRRANGRAHLTVDGRTVAITHFDLWATSISLWPSAGELRISFPYHNWSPATVTARRFGFAGLARGRSDNLATLEGDEARIALAVLLPVLNGMGGSRKTVQSATSYLESSGPPEQRVQELLRHPSLPKTDWDLVNERGGSTMTGATRIPPAIRLALEMCVHEDDERRALEGELHVLEQRWKDAEEVAAIADGLLLPTQKGQGN